MKLKFDEADQENLNKVWRGQMRQINLWAKMLADEGSALSYPFNEPQSDVLDRAKSKGFPKGVVIAALKVRVKQSEKAQEFLDAYKVRIGLEYAA